MGCAECERLWKLYAHRRDLHLKLLKGARWGADHLKEALERADNERQTARDQLIKHRRTHEKSARGIGTMAHTAPEEAAQVLALLKPRLAVVFHFFNDFDTAPDIEREIRKHYQGPLALAQDLMVFNVTPDDIRIRMAVTATHVWPNKERHEDFRTAVRKQRRPMMSRWLADKQLFPKF